MPQLPPRTGRLADDWRTDASCRGLDTNLFFPPGSAGANWTTLDHARHICDHCLIQQKCLQWALTADVTDDIWATSPPSNLDHTAGDKGATTTPVRMPPEEC